MGTRTAPQLHARGAFGDAGEAMRAVSRLLETPAAPEGPLAVGDALVREARRFFRASRAVLVDVDEAQEHVEIQAMDPAGDPPPELLPLSDLRPLARMLGTDAPEMSIDGRQAAELAGALGAYGGAGVLLLPLQVEGAVRHVLVLVDDREREFSEDELEVAKAFAAAAAASLVRLRLEHERTAQTARQVALARAAKNLNESLDLNRVLVGICEESASILGADTAVVYVGDALDGLRVEAAFGLQPEAIGLRLRAGEGLAGKVAERDEPLLTNDYQGMPGRPDVYSEFRSALAVPMHRDGQLHGVLSLGWTRPHLLTRDHLGLLSAFGELAAAACRNASAHEGLALAARTDGLTGCLNHAALHETLGRELERCRRTGQPLSLALVDLDDFKRVNELHGHLVGDEVLRRVGQSLRQTVRAYDVVGRYGGDEFAIVAVDTTEADAAEVAARAIHRCGAGATAGVAEWRPDESATEVIARADGALLFGKQNGRKGEAFAASAVPQDAPQPALSESR